MKTLIKLLSVFFFNYWCCSCKSQNEKNDLNMYVMPKQLTANEDGRMEYYRTYNFIIDTGSRIYFYQREPYFTGCGIVNWWQQIRIPLFIDLNPKDLIEIPADYVDEFTRLNILTVKDYNRDVIICSPCDTVFSDGLSKIMKIFKDTNNHVKWAFRKTTQEENIVLSYKKKPYSYFSHYDFKWDSTKTLFFEVIEKMKKQERDSFMLTYEKNPPSRNAVFKPTKICIPCRDSIYFRKLAAALKLKVEDVYIQEIPN